MKQPCFEAREVVFPFFKIVFHWPPKMTELEKHAVAKPAGVMLCKFKSLSSFMS